MIAQATQTKYALVCGGCFRHNGLVGDKDEWENMSKSFVSHNPLVHQSLMRIVHFSCDVEWICPRCGYFNPSPKSRRSSSITETTIPSTPTTTTTAIANSGTEGDVRQRKKKSSGLKHEVEPEVGDRSSDRMDVDDEPMRAAGKQQGAGRET